MSGILSRPSLLLGAVVSLAISADSSMLYAATQGEGLFRMELAVPK